MTFEAYTRCVATAIYMEIKRQPAIDLLDLELSKLVASKPSLQVNSITTNGDCYVATNAIKIQ